MAETDVGSGIFLERERDSGTGLFRAGAGFGSFLLTKNFKDMKPKIIYASDEEKQSMRIHDLTFDFAKRIVSLYRDLRYSEKDDVISKQILKSGTSIGANLYESKYPQSDADYLSKVNIALKEASETEYWLKLLKDTDYISETEADSLIIDCSRIIKILICIVKKVSNRIK